MERTRAVLLDLGNTLVRYYTVAEVPGMLAACLAGVAEHLSSRGLHRIAAPRLLEVFRPEQREESDHRVRPLWSRITRALEADGYQAPDDCREAVERAFLGPIFAVSRPYEDTMPFLRELRDRGYTTVVVSNTPWGAPGALWRTEIARHGLAPYIDHEVFCTDVGWRKPARAVFERALCLCGAAPEDAVFVGDDPRWDVEGPVALGMSAILVDRAGWFTGEHSPVVRDLQGALAWLDGRRPAGT
jgi:putative hydrolase of the HAD superfamily